MSTFVRVTKHPQSKKYELATWVDDYFGSHIYGVHFKSDGKVYPTELVDKGEVKNFWVEDVKIGFLKFLEDNDMTEQPNEDLLDFLNYIQLAYNERWERDPLLGEGATMQDTEDDEPYTD